MVFLSLSNYYRIDSLIDFFILVISFLVFIQARSIYHIKRDRGFKFFATSFLMIAFAFLFKIFANLTELYEINLPHPSSILSVFLHIGSFEAIHFFGYAFFKILFISGLIALFLVFIRAKNFGEMALLFYLGTLSIILSLYFNFIFHFSLIFILFLICTHFYNSYRKTKSSLTFRLFVAFVLILLSNVVSLFIHLDFFVYILSEIILFAGFVTILFVHLKIKNGEKKIKIRNS